jgi:hypothetical protein
MQSQPVSCAGEDYTTPLTLVANGYLIHGPHMRTTDPETLELDLPFAATSGGTLDLKWIRPKGLGGGGRGLQIAEVWLVPRSFFNSMHIQLTPQADIDR